MVYRKAKYIYLSGGVVREFRTDTSEKYGDLVGGIEVAPITGGVSVKVYDLEGKMREFMHLGGCTAELENE